VLVLVDFVMLLMRDVRTCKQHHTYGVTAWPPSEFD
jgi:hypothetical protein